MIGSHVLMWVFVGSLAFSASKVSSASEQNCRIVARGSMVSCFGAEEEDLPKSTIPTVEWIAFTKSSIPHIKANSLKYFPKLTDLHAESSGIEKIDENAFQYNTALNWIDLSSNKIKYVGANLIRFLLNIENFNIGDNKDLVIPERKPFLVSENLRWLVMRNWGIRKLYSESFEKLPALRDLSLAGNHLKTLPEDIFWKNSGLLSLDITDNKISFLSDHTFLHLGTMVLRFEDNPWNCGCELTPLLLWSKRNIVKGTVKCEKPKDKQWNDIHAPQHCKPITK